MTRQLTRIIAISAAFLSPPAIAQTAEESARIEKRGDEIVAAMQGTSVYTEVFADVFVNAVSEAQFTAIKGQIEAQFGPMIGVDYLDPISSSGARIAIRFERGLASGPFRLELQEPYEVTGIVLNDVRPIGDSVEQSLSDIEGLPGETGMLVTRLGAQQPLAAHNADRQFAIGSTFKLYVLSALAQSIAAGERSWHDVVPLNQRSYPSGQLQEWPQGAPVTLYTLATLMISISDNTATDQLIVKLGRDAVEAELVAAGHSHPEMSIPFLTTRELFVLKSGDAANLGQYASAGTAERLAVLQQLAAIERAEGDIQAAFSGAPVAIDIEWFASANDIARLFQRLAELEDETALKILAVNHSMSDAMRAEWDYVCYKGGSEPGVLNLSWLLRDASGEWVVVSMSWNDAEAKAPLSCWPCALLL